MTHMSMTAAFLLLVLFLAASSEGLPCNGDYVASNVHLNESGAWHGWRHDELDIDNTSALCFDSAGGAFGGPTTVQEGSYIQVDHNASLVTASNEANALINRSHIFLNSNAKAQLGSVFLNRASIDLGAWAHFSTASFGQVVLGNGGTIYLESRGKLYAGNVTLDGASISIDSHSEAHLQSTEVYLGKGGTIYLDYFTHLYMGNGILDGASISLGFHAEAHLQSVEVNLGKGDNINLDNFGKLYMGNGTLDGASISLGFHAQAHLKFTKVHLKGVSLAVQHFGRLHGGSGTSIHAHSVAIEVTEYARLDIPAGARCEITSSISVRRRAHVSLSTLEGVECAEKGTPQEREMKKRIGELNAKISAHV